VRPHFGDGAGRIENRKQPQGGLKWNDVAHLASVVPDDEIRFRIVIAVALLEIANDKLTVIARRIVVRQIR
jgi:hypothetical protein